MLTELPATFRSACLPNGWRGALGLTCDLAVLIGNVLKQKEQEARINNGPLAAYRTSGLESGPDSIHRGLTAIIIE